MGIQLRTLTGLLLGVMAAAQTETALQVTHVGGKWYAHNISKQAITGYVLHTGYEPLHLTPTEINCGPVELQWVPLLPGATVEIRLKPGFTEVSVPAVILEDGSVIGAAVTAEGMDMVADMFAWRRGEAHELARWLRILRQSDHSQALADFRRQAHQDVPMTGGVEGSGRYAAASMMRGQLNWLGHTPGTDEEVYQQLLAIAQDRSAFAERSSERRTK